MPPSEPSITVFEATPGFVLAAWRRIFFHVWRGPATVEGVEQSHEYIRPWLSTQSQDVGLLVVSRPEFGMPSEASRQAMERLVRASPDRLKATGVLLESEGFIAAFARALAAGQRLLRPGPSVFEVFRTPEDAGRWLGAYLGEVEHPVPAFLAALRCIREPRRQ